MTFIKFERKKKHFYDKKNIYFEAMDRKHQLFKK